MPGTSVYPTALDAFVDDYTDTSPTRHVGPDLDDARAAIDAIQEELGILPSGDAADVAERLDAGDSVLAAEVANRVAAIAAEAATRAAAIATEAAARAAAIASEAVARDAAIATHTADATNVHGTGTVVTSDNIDDFAPAPDLTPYALDADLDSETSSRIADDATETAARIAADNAEATARATAVTNEASARAAGDVTNAASAAAAQTTADAALPKAGGTMTGDLVLAGDPTANLHPATRQYVLARISDLIGGAPGTLDTLNEIAAQLATDESAVSTLTSTVAGKLTAASNLSDLVNAVTARTNLGLGSAATHAHGDYDAAGAAAAAQAASQPVDADLTAIAALSTTAFGRALLEVLDAAAGRTALGLGTASTHAHGDYDAAGAAAAAQAASQPLDSDLTAIAALAPSNDSIVQRKSGVWVARTMAQVKTDLALVSSDVGLGNVTNDAQIAKSLVDAKGDILIGTANDTPARKAVGANGTYLRGDSSDTDGLSFGNPVHLREPIDQGLKAWAYDPAMAGSAFTITGGVTYIGEIYIREPQTITKIWWEVLQALAAGGGGAANLFFGLYALLSGTTTLTLIAKTADQKTAMSGAAGQCYGANLVVEAGQSLTFDGTKRVWGAGLIGTQGSTTLQLARGARNPTALKQVAGTDPLRGARSGTGQSALPSTIAISGLLQDQILWTGVE